MAKTRAFGSCRRSMSSNTTSSFWKEQASETLPGNASRQSATTSTARMASSADDSGGVNVLNPTQHHRLQRVAAKTQAQRLERDHLVGRDVPEVHRRPELLDEPRLGSLRRRLEDDVRGPDGVRDLVDQIRSHAARRVEDPGSPAFTRLGDHLPGARLELLVQPLRPLTDRVLDAGVLRAHLGEDCEVAREVGDQLELALARDLDRAVRDLDVGQAELDQPLFVFVEPVLRVDHLEERPTDYDRL